MKRIARYRIELESNWVTLSALLMGIAFFVQAMYFLAFGHYQTAGGWINIFFMIIPMALEFAWFILLKGVKLNAAGVYGIIAAVICLVLIVQHFVTGSILQMIFGTLMYLVAAGLALLVTGGYFPYKLIAIALFAGIGLVRVLVFDLVRFILPGNWQGMVLELPALCMIFAMMLFFGGITGLRDANHA